MTPNRRLFFALWPDETTRGALAEFTREAVRRSGGRRVPAENFHVTLAFLGDQPATLFDAIVRVGAAIVATPFELTLNRFGYWPKPRAFWIGPTETPPALARLADDLWDGMEALGLPREQRLFKPHVTLARKVTAVPEVARPDSSRWRDSWERHPAAMAAPEVAGPDSSRRRDPWERHPAAMAAPEVAEPDLLRWVASSFALIESAIDQHGARYTVAREFPLTALGSSSDPNQD